MGGTKTSPTPLCLQNSISYGYVFLIYVVQSLYIFENIFYLLPVNKEDYNPKIKCLSLYELFLFWLVSSPNILLS